MKSHVWKYKDKKTGREALYGNLRELCKNETITIDGAIKSEHNVRWLLKNKDIYFNDDILIKKTEVIRGHFNKTK